MTGLRQRAFVPVLLFVGAVVAVVSSLGAPLIPRLAEQLNTSVANTQWALTATLVVAAVASPLVGRLGDGRHRKTVITACLSLVVLGGALAAIATSLSVLILGRALQGFGLALMPLTMAAAREHLPAAQAGRAIAALSVVGAAGVGLGYPITGFIADHGGVAAAYWFGTAVSALALILAALVVPKPGNAPKHQHLDLPGAVIIGVGLVALLVGLDKGADWGWGSARVPALLATAVVLIGLWAWHELRTTSPLVDLRLVRHRSVLTANVTGLLLGMTMYLLMVSITQYVQNAQFGFGATVFVAGLTLVPLSIMSGAASRFLPWLETTVGFRPIIPAGALCVSAASLLFATTGTELWQAFVTMGILGIGMGLTFAAMPALIVGAVPASETGSAMGFYQVSRFVGFAIGSGLAVTLMRAFGTDGIPTASAYAGVAYVGAAFGVITALVAWLLPGKTAPTLTDELERYEQEDGLLAAAGLEDIEPALAPRGAALTAAAEHSGALPVASR